MTKKPQQYKQIFDKISVFMNTKIHFTKTNMKCSYQMYFARPCVEKGGQKIMDRVFPHFKGKIGKVNLPTRENVRRSNDESLSIACAAKKVHPYMVNVAKKTLFDLIEGTNFKANRMRTASNCYDSLKSNTSACYPFFKKKGDPDVRNNSIKLMKNILRRRDPREICKVLYRYPTVVFNRYSSQLNKRKEVYNVNYKIRQIYGVPAFICALEELCFSDVVDSFLKSYKRFHSIGLTRLQVSHQIKKFRDNSKSSDILFCGDLSKADLSITPLSLQLLSTYLIVGLKDRKELYPIAISLLKYLTYTPILTDKGDIVTTMGMNTSGSRLTTFVNTFTLILILKSFVKLSGLDAKFIVLGDDFIINLGEDFNKIIELKKFLKAFNLTINVHKSKVTSIFEDIDYLGFSWDNQNKPDAPDTWLYKKVVYPENYVEDTSGNRIISRYLSILFLLKRYYVLFNRFLSVDPILRTLYRHSKLVVPIYKYDRLISEQVFPISELLRMGWKLT